MTKFIYKNIMRAKAKAALGIAVALLFTFALGFLQNTISDMEAEINRIYEETVVWVEIRLSQDFRRSWRELGDVVPNTRVQNILDLGVIGGVHLEGVGLGYHNDRELIVVGRTSDTLTFAHPIPIIAYEGLGFSLGQILDIDTYMPILFREGQWSNNAFVVEGFHNGAELPVAVSESIIVPYDALQYLYGDIRGYFTARFTIDPAFNREMEDISEQIRQYARWAQYPWREPLTADIWDQDLRLTVSVLEQHVELLKMLFPIALGVSGAVGFAVSLLMVLQNARNAAIMRILGRTKTYTRVVLWLWQSAISADGAIVGVLLSLIIGLSVGDILVTLVYLLGAVIGAAVGAIIITSRPPLLLLQQK